MHISKSHRGYGTGPLNSSADHNQDLITADSFEAFVSLAIHAKDSCIL